MKTSEIFKPGDIVFYLNDLDHPLYVVNVIRGSVLVKDLETNTLTLVKDSEIIFKRKDLGKCLKRVGILRAIYSAISEYYKETGDTITDIHWDRNNPKFLGVIGKKLGFKILGISEETYETIR